MSNAGPESVDCYLPSDFAPSTLACVRLEPLTKQFKQGRVKREEANVVKQWKGETAKERLEREVAEGRYLDWDSSSSD